MFRKTAQKFDTKPGQFRETAFFYKLSEPVEYDYDYDTEKFLKETRFVCVSQANAFGSGYETFIFPADENGEVVDWSELEGSLRGYISPDQLMRECGWSVVDGRNTEWNVVDGEWHNKE